jgi:cytochrome subunit of sulfide dehydrogenase
VIRLLAAAAGRVGALVLPFVITAGAIAAGPPPGAASCSGCHPASAAVTTPVPQILDRKTDEIIAAMLAFRAGERPSTVMGRIAKGFSDDEIRAIAVWLAAQQEKR